MTKNKALARGIAVLLAVVTVAPLPAQAAIVTFDYHFAFTGLGGPADPLAGDLHLTFDNAATINTIPVTIDNFTLPGAQPARLYYDANADYLQIASHPVGNGFDPNGEGAFGLQFLGVSGGAPSALFGGYTSGGNFRGTNNGTLTSLAAPGAPAPLLGLGLLPALAALGGAVAFRRRRAALA